MKQEDKRYTYNVI